VLAPLTAAHVTCKLVGERGLTVEMLKLLIGRDDASEEFTDSVPLKARTT
jgi:hypothetical protein